MAAQFRVDFERRDGSDVLGSSAVYVFASDDKAGYRKARVKAEARVAREVAKGKLLPGAWKPVRVSCVG